MSSGISVVLGNMPCGSHLDPPSGTPSPFNPQLPITLVPNTVVLAESVDRGDLLTTSSTDGRWRRFDPNNSGDMPTLVAKAAGSVGSSVSVAEIGEHATLSTIGIAPFGAKLWADPANVGKVTATAPSTGFPWLIGKNTSVGGVSAWLTPERFPKA